MTSVHRYTVANDHTGRTITAARGFEDCTCKYSERATTKRLHRREGLVRVHPVVEWTCQLAGLQFNFPFTGEYTANAENALDTCLLKSALFALSPESTNTECKLSNHFMYSDNNHYSFGAVSLHSFSFLRAVSANGDGRKSNPNETEKALRNIK